MISAYPRFALLAVVVALTACADPPPIPDPAVPHTTADRSGSLPRARTSTSSDSQSRSSFLSVEPTRQLDCTDPNVTTSALVTWDASSVGIDGVDVYVQSKEEEINVTKLWASGGVKGSETTPPWVRAGTSFELRIKGSDEVIAQRSVDCF